ncbi:MAG: TldD/PmbA family protein [Acidobacteria bacterium]|nr:TldD/PmbA family protein [Acidobacteriota bacterium]
MVDLATEIVSRAVRAGATDAECTAVEGQEFSANVRLGEVESLKEAGSKAIGLRVLIGRRSGSSYTSDFSPGGLDRLVDSAVALARITSEDPSAGLPEPEELGAAGEELGLYYEDVAGLSADDKIALARRAERAALDADPRITNSEGGAFNSAWSRRALANSRGFQGEYRRSSCSLSVVPVARSGEEMQRDYWYSLSHSLAALEPPESVGRRAAERALGRLGAVKVETRRVPVVFEPRTARTLLESLFEAVNGDSIYRHASFLAGKLGETIAAPEVTVVDDGTMPGGFGSSPFDDEGVPSRRTLVVESGILRSYLLNSYTARKLGLKTTGNASRGLAGNPGIGPGNFYLLPGPYRPEEILASVGEGLFVTELIGFGVNMVTGDYSRGAAGMWLRDGKPAFPVHEVTIAGNLSQMFRDVEMIGSDLEFRGAIAAPTLKIREMTVGGK